MHSQRLELEELRNADYNLARTGFEDGELARLLAAQDASEGLTDEDDVPEIVEKNISVTGDSWKLGTHRVRCGDTTKLSDVEELMGAERADCVLPTLPTTSTTKATRRRS